MDKDNILIASVVVVVALAVAVVICWMVWQTNSTQRTAMEHGYRQVPAQTIPEHWEKQ